MRSRAPGTERVVEKSQEQANENIPAAPSAAHLIRTVNRDPETTAFEIAVTSFFFDAADLLGVPKSVAVIYGLCFASPEPLSFADLTERLEISSGSISQGLRVLREVGALKVVSGFPSSSVLRLPSSGDSKRRDYYEPDLELRNLVSRFIESRLQKQVSSGRTRLQAIARSVPGSNGSAKVLKARLKALQTWHDKGRALMPVIKTFLKLT